MRVSGLFTSAKEGMEDRRSEKRFCTGKRLFLAYQSGVGKSSLINLLQSEVMMETGEYQQEDRQRKAYDETFRTLVLEEDEKVEDCGSYIVDTPGFSSLYVNDFEKNN